MLPGPYSLLLLLFFALTYVLGVTCPTCKDTIQGCHGGADCPLLKTVGANRAAILAAAGGALSLVALVPERILAFFTRPSLETLASLVARTGRGAAPYDFSGKDPSDIVAAVFDGTTSFVEAAPVLLKMQKDSSDEGAKANVMAALSLLTTYDKVHKAPNTARTHGVYLFLWAKVSQYVMTSQGKVVATVSTGSGSSLEGSGSAKGSASLSHPKYDFQFFEMLNWFNLLLHVTGVNDTCVTAPFLDDVVYRPMRKQNYSWMMAYELLIVYLTYVECSELSTINLGTIYNTGGRQRS